MELMQHVVKKEKRTLVMVTHDSELASYADRVIRIIDGHVVSNEVRKQERKEEPIVKQNEMEERGEEIK